MSDPADLFQPTVQHATATLPPPGSRPWRPTSIGLVGFFGGPLAATMHALANLKRMDAADGEEARRTRMIGFGVTALVVVGQVATLFLLDDWRAHRRLVRLGVQIGGYAVGHVLANVQAGAMRRWFHRVRADEDSFDGAFWPGLGRALGWGAVASIPSMAVVVWLELA